MISNILPYFIFFAIMLLIASLDVWSIRLNQKSRFYVLGFSFAMLALIAGLRWFDVPLMTFDGTWQIFDYSAYEYTFDNPMSLDNFIDDFKQASIYTQSMDPGYVYLSSIFSNYITNDANIFFLIMSIITVWLFISGLKRNHITYAIFLIIFIYFCRLYYQYNFIMMRQAIAMSIAWWAIPFVIQRRLRFFIFHCLLAGLFHFTGFLFVIVYWLPRFKFSNKFLAWTIPILLILGVSGLTSKLIMLILEQGLSMVGMGDKVSAYLLNSTYARGINPLNFVELAPFLYFGIRYREKICETPNGKFFFNLLILYTVFMLVTMNFMALTRISSYYIYSFLFIFNFVYGKIKLYGNKVLIGYAFCAYFFLYGMRFIEANFIALGYNTFIMK